MQTPPVKAAPYTGVYIGELHSSSGQTIAGLRGVTFEVGWYRIQGLFDESLMFVQALKRFF